MQFTDAEIYATVRHLIARGYAALTQREKLIVDTLSAIC